MAPPAVQGPAVPVEPEPETPVFREARFEGGGPSKALPASSRMAVVVSSTSSTSTTSSSASDASPSSNVKTAKTSSLPSEPPQENKEDLRSSFVNPGVASDWLDNVHTKLYQQPDLADRIRDLITRERRSETAQRQFFTLVSGPAGTGRRFATQQVLEQIAAETDGYFVFGKLDAVFQPVPYAAFLMCISQYIHHVCEAGPREVERFRSLIQEHVGRNVAALRVWLPCMDRILGPPEEESSSSSSSSHDGGTDRFARALKYLYKAMSYMGRPTYMLLENIQFADATSLDLMTEMLRFPPRCGGYMVATCDSGVAADSLVATKLREIENCLGLEIVNISTPLITEDKIYQALKDTELNPEEQRKLARLAHERSGGDTFLVGLFLRWVHNKRILSRDLLSGSIVVDEEEIDIVLGSHKSCRELLTDELVALPAQHREMLKVAACLGHLIDEKFLGSVLDQDTEQIVTALGFMQEKGYVNTCNQMEGYCFSHDCVQQAAFALIPTNDLPLFRLEIGRRLWRKESIDELGTLFTILEQMKQGSNLIRRENERIAIAQLCLYAGQRAATSSSFAKALSVLEFGVFLLLDDRYWRTEYDLVLALCSSTIEMQCYAGNFEEMDDLIEYTLSHARSLADKMRAYTCKVNSLSLRGNLSECVDVGSHVLSLLGIPMSKRTCHFHIFAEFRGIRKLLREKSDETLLRLPKMTDRDSIEAMRILSLLMFPAMSTKSALAPLTMLLLMKLTLTKGHSVFSPIAFVSYGLFCTSPVYNEIDEAYRFGQLALKLQQQESRIEYMPRVFVSYFGFIHGWKQPVKESMMPLLKANKIAQEYGDLEFASISMFLFCMNSIETGQPLGDISTKADAMLDDVISRGYDGLAMMTSPFIQYIRRLTGTDGLVCMDGLIKQAREAKFAKAECIAGLWKIRIAYIFGEFEEAGKIMEEMDWSVLMTAPQYALIAIAYVSAMIACSNIRIGRNVRYYNKKVKKVMNKFKQWARYCPHECSGKSSLIEAEWASIHGKNDVAREKYTNAILMAKGMENDYELATAHERAMHHYRTTKDDCAAEYHGEEAYKAYVKWGATAKASHLRRYLDSIPSARLIISLPEALSQGPEYCL